MSISDVVLPANRMVLEVRRDMALVRRFTSDREGLIAAYGLGDAEKEAFRKQDLKQMAAPRPAPVLPHLGEASLPRLCAQSPG